MLREVKTHLSTIEMTTRIPRLDKALVVTATALKHYVRDTGISDWIIQYGSSRDLPVKTFSNTYLASRGIKYELGVVNQLRQKLQSQDLTTVCSEPWDVYSLDKLNETKQHLSKGTPVIYQGALYNSLHQLVGIPDLLIRGDYIERLLGVTPPLVKSRKSCLENNYIYYVVDIKSKRVKTLRDGRISDSNGFVHYKAQLATYNMCLRSTQLIESTRAYMYTPGGVGTLYFDGKDDFYYNLVENARDWVLDMRKTGAKWDPTNILMTVPARYHHAMITNLKVYDEATQEAKEKLARETESISLLPFCGEKQLELATRNGVFSYTNPKCTPELLGLTGERARIVKGVIDINTGHSIVSYRRLPKTDTFKCYLDMEFVNSAIFDNVDFTGTLVYHIGLSWEYKNGLKHQNFVVRDLSEESEFEIFKRLQETLSEFSRQHGAVEVYHWSTAEKTQIERVVDKYENLDFTSLELVDLCEVCKRQELFVKGCFSYGLKDVSRALHQHRRITTTWGLDTATKSQTLGLCTANVVNLASQAALLKVPLYQVPDYKAIEKYNQVDCAVMHEIMKLLTH